MPFDFQDFGGILISSNAPRLGESDMRGERAHVLAKIVNPANKHHKWYVLEVDPDGTAFGWFQSLRDHGEYGNFNLFALAEKGMVQENMESETIASLRECGLIG